MAKLLLIPTQPELAVLQPLLDEAARLRGWSMELCGFGPIAAAARTAFLIARNQPARVLLLGIAGTYRSQVPIGTATMFDHVACYGVGVGTGEHHQAAGDLGWPQRQEPVPSCAIGDVLPLDQGNDHTPSGHGHLLTCCAASATAEDIQCRTRQHPQATAEDMEGFGVALACELSGVRLQIARGISNLAGDRNKDNWLIAGALQAVAELALSIIEQE